MKGLLNPSRDERSRQLEFFRDPETRGYVTLRLINELTAYFKPDELNTL